MMSNLKVGHRVLTIGGIHGEITYIDLENPISSALKSLTTLKSKSVALPLPEI